MQFFNAGEMRLEGTAEAFGQEGDSLTHPLPFADGDLVVAEINVLDPKAETLEQAQSAPI